MKLPDSDINTESHGVLSTTEFGIKQENVGILLDILRTKIYKNPVLAVCREISCNARDAHREVHDDPNNPTTRDTPIHIYLPNAGEPTVRFQDFGPGINPGRKNIFVSFGDSTKREDNIQTGGYGLGCKTPYAYVQSFTVDTVAEIPGWVYKCLVGNTRPRMQYVYNAYIEKTKKGAMDLMRMDATDEPFGTSIIIPVKAADFRKFEDTIIECTKHWAVKPILFGGDPDRRPEYPKMVELYRGTDWVMYTEGITYPCAIVDGIEYPIDRSSITFETDLQRKMLQYGFCIEFGVGELSLAASRDHLAYDDPTVEKILAKVDKIAKEVKGKVAASVTEAKSYFEACDKYRWIKKQIPNIMSELGDLKWNDHKLQVTCNVHEIGKWAKLIGYSAKNGQVLVNRSNDSIAFNDPKVMLIHNDKTTHLNKHVVMWLLSQNPDITSIQAVYTPEQPSSAAWKEAVERYGDASNIPVKYDMDLLELLEPVKYSTIQVPKTKTLRQAAGDVSERMRLEDGNINGYSLHGTRVYRTSDDYSRGDYRLKADASQFPRDEGGVYVVYDYKTKKAYNEGKEIRYDKYRLAKKLLGEDIIGLSPKRAHMVAGDLNWQTIEEALQDKFDLWEEKMSGEDLKSLLLKARYAYQNRMFEYTKWLTQIEDEGSPIIAWVAKAEALLEEADEYKPALELYGWFGHNLTPHDGYYSGAGRVPHTDPVVLMHKKVDEWYPLLDHINSTATTTMEQLIEYVNVMDKYRTDLMMERLISELSSPEQIAVAN